MFFTQGKWRYEEYVPNGVTINGKEYIIYTGSVNPDEEGEDIALARREDDARLIAAAPEMYKILCDIRDDMCNLNVLPDTEDNIYKVLKAIDGRENMKGGEVKC